MNWRCETCNTDHPSSYNVCPVSGHPSPVSRARESMKPAGEKAPLHLLPASPLRAIASAFLCGAVEYEPWNWMQFDEARIEEARGALRRHIASYLDPSEASIDEKSGLHHLALAGANVMMLLWHEGIDHVRPRNVR